MNQNFSEYVDVLREQNLLPSSTRCVFVTGSLARGWVHETSDIDLVVVSAEPFEDDRLAEITVVLEPDSLGLAAFTHEGRRGEVKYWLDTQVDQLFGKVSRKAFDEDQRIGSRLTEVEEFFLGRLGTCIPILGEDWLLRRQQDLQESAFQRFMIMQALNNSDRAADAAFGLLASGEADGAVLAARQAFGWSMEALLINHGEYSVDMKWRPRRMRVAAPSLVSYEQYWSIETMREYSTQNPGEWVETVVDLCKELSMEIEV
ncbi:nucleotidyltransferase domain-containing protein [Micromonospora ureilytica]|uniref:nucleotidyltransferase domain-containing protein n=1 Tax=Micromonospora ureilytica TaxID=709868 RepID=UPI002E0FF986|nr:nucleotidyltransferase domain-containing protein [Micromonospora ureilytica]